MRCGYGVAGYRVEYSHCTCVSGSQSANQYWKCINEYRLLSSEKCTKTHVFLYSLAFSAWKNTYFCGARHDFQPSRAGLMDCFRAWHLEQLVALPSREDRLNSSDVSLGAGDEGLAFLARESDVESKNFPNEGTGCCPVRSWSFESHLFLFSLRTTNSFTAVRTSAEIGASKLWLEIFLSTFI